MATGHELEPLVIQEDLDVPQQELSPRRKASELPIFESSSELDDNLNDVSLVIWHFFPYFFIAWRSKYLQAVTVIENTQLTLF